MNDTENSTDMSGFGMLPGISAAAAAGAVVSDEKPVRWGGAGGSWELDPDVKVINSGRVEIDKHRDLKPGDKIEIEMIPKVGGVNALAYKIMKFEDDPRFEVTSWGYLDKGVVLKITIKETPPTVQKAGIITSGVIIAAILGITAIMVSTTIYKMPGAVADAADDLGKTFETQGGKVVATSFSGVTLGLLLVVGLYFWKKK